MSLRKQVHVINRFLVSCENEIFHLKRFDIFLIFAVLRSTNNPCFGAKIRKIGIPLHTPVLLYKSEV